MLLNTAVLAIIYYGFGVCVALTEASRSQLEHCKWFVGATLLVMTVSDVVYQLMEVSNFYWVYAGAFVPVAVGYIVKVVYSYHKGSEGASLLVSKSASRLRECNFPNGLYSMLVSTD